MNVTRKLADSIHIDTPAARVPTHEDLKDLAKDILYHPLSCQCQACQTFNKAVGNKGVVAPSVTMTLTESFKNVTRGDGGGRARLPAHSVKVEDEAGPAPKKKRKTSEKLLASLGAVIKG